MLVVVGYCKGELLPPDINSPGFVNNIRQTYQEYSANCPHDLFREIISFYEMFKGKKNRFSNTAEYENWLNQCDGLPKTVLISGAWTQYCVVGSTLTSLERGIDVIVDPSLTAMPREATVEERLRILDNKICNVSDGKYWNPEISDNKLCYKSILEARKSTLERFLTLFKRKRAADTTLL